MKKVIALVLVLVAGGASGAAKPRVSEASVRAHLEFLASDALNGRGSGTRDEQIAAEYVGAHFRRLGLKPGGTDGGYVQTVEVVRTAAAGKPDALIRPTVVSLNADAALSLASVPDGTQVRIATPAGEPTKSHTYNAVGILAGKNRSGEAILISAHLDHLGRRETVQGPDKIHNGADDNASGTVAVMEIAEALAKKKTPQRTIIFACFGSEEAGGFGATYLREMPPVPLEKMVAMVQFEMIGRPDSKVPAKTLWLTGYERSDLGPTLARRGARLVQDPHPEMSFFTRSDNITFARRGVVAHTVSSYGLHKEYHTPADETKAVDYAHMTEAIASMIDPLAWLANTTFKPAWKPGMRP